MKILCIAAVVITVAGCRRSDDFSRRSDSTITPPVSVDTGRPPADTVPIARNCGVTGAPTIENDGIGDLKVGRKVSDIRSLCEVTSDSEEMGTEGTKERILVTQIGGSLVQSLVDNDRIMRIAVTTPQIRTRDSLGVDTPLHTLAGMPGARLVPGEDGVYGFVGDHCGLSFRFSIPLRPPAGRDWTVDAATRAHGDAAVDRVLITRCAR